MLNKIKYYFHPTSLTWWTGVVTAIFGGVQAGIALKNGDVAGAKAQLPTIAGGLGAIGIKSSIVGAVSP